MVASYHVNSAYKGNINKVLLPTNYELLIPASALASRNQTLLIIMQLITYGTWLSLKLVDFSVTSGKYTTCPQKHTTKISEGPDAMVTTELAKRKTTTASFSKKYYPRFCLAKHAASLRQKEVMDWSKKKT